MLRDKPADEWALVERLAGLDERSFDEAVYEAVESSGDSIEVRLERFHKLWTRLLVVDRSKLRRLALAFTFLESECIAGRSPLCDLYKGGCLYLPEVLLDDSDWTGFEVPYE